MPAPAVQPEVDTAQAANELNLTEKMAVLVGYAKEGEFGQVAKWMAQLAGDELVHSLGVLESGVILRVLKANEGVLLLMLKHWLADTWPVGLGVQLDASAGITFGIPIGADVRNQRTLTHHKYDALHLRSYIDGFVGLDTGIGVGAFLGSSKGGMKGKRGEFGVGAHAHAGLKAGLAGTMVMEHEFPLFDDGTLLTAILSFLGFNGPLTELAGHFLNKLSTLDDSSYLTKHKVELKVVGDLQGEASAGLRQREKDKGEGESTVHRFTRHEGREGDGTDNHINQSGGDSLRDRAESGIVSKIMRSLKASAAGQIAAELGAGLETEFTSFGKDPNGNRAPTGMKVELYGEGHALKNLSVSIPGLDTFLPKLTDHDMGGGIKLIWPSVTINPASPLAQHGFEVVDAVASGQLMNLGWPKIQVYGKTGDDDLYEGNSAEIAATYDPQAGQLDGIHFKARVGLGGALGRDYAKHLTRQKNLSTGLKGKYRAFGGDGKAHLDLEIEVSGDDIRAFIEEAKQLGVKLTADPLGEVRRLVNTYLTTGQITGALKDFAEKVEEIVTRSVKKANARFALGAGVAAGVAIKDGLHARLQGAASGALVYTVDLMGEIQSLTQVLQQQSGSPDLKLPHCPAPGE